MRVDGHQPVRTKLQMIRWVPASVQGQDREEVVSPGVRDVSALAMRMSLSVSPLGHRKKYAGSWLLTTTLGPALVSDCNIQPIS